METNAWILDGQNGIESLKKIDNRELPALGDHDVLVQMHAASLNHRDVAIAEAQHGLCLEKPIIPTSDGAGTVRATGANVKTFKPGDKVCTHLLPHKFYAEPATFPEIMTGLGHGTDGALCTYGIFHETAFVRMPEGLLFVEASTLPCAGLTAWNALFGLRGLKRLKEGDVVLVQGTGGVSVFAMQFALAAGATVIATTSSEAKAPKLASLGAHHVLNYKTDPNWGETAKQLTPDKKGVHVVVNRRSVNRSKP
ncbi:hypothetical protein SI65_07430 [Aspergillus cristatus]|uniref:Enoyl reductase (ER) domain-containing protein n=1 Tax=Aspergillus cristatus TaxID=573508 RepID=A0A1E3B8A1_ASPCR|nr:hypothetical protein SI65_07430 [Aspergillus cristatus]